MVCTLSKRVWYAADIASIVIGVGIPRRNNLRPIANRPVIELWSVDRVGIWGKRKRSPVTSFIFQIVTYFITPWRSQNKVHYQVCAWIGSLRSQSMM